MLLSVLVKLEKLLLEPPILSVTPGHQQVESERSPKADYFWAFF